MSAHGPVLLFWGGALDGLKFEATLESRHVDPPEWHRGYRRSEVVRHGTDNSVCMIRYIWREKWTE